MDTSRPAALAELLDRADVRQATFARLAGVTARQVNNWCRGRARAPRWALVLAAILAERSPEELALTLDEALSELAVDAPAGSPGDGDDPNGPGGGRSG